MRRSVLSFSVVAAATLCLLALAGGAQAASPCGTSGTYSVSGTTATCTYGATGSEDTFGVPSGVSSVSVTAIGAGGSAGEFGGAGGPGAQVSNTALPVTAGATLYVDVGQGSFPDGGDRDCYAVLCTGSGGGSSAVMTSARASATLSGTSSTDSRLIVAGGGGGAGATGDGGSAGDPAAVGGGAGSCDGTGGAGGVGPTDGSNGGGKGACGGADGSASRGGAGGHIGGGGGGGWFGGGGGATNGCIGTCGKEGGGGGGSSYGGAGSGTVTVATASSSQTPQVVISWTDPPVTLTLPSDGSLTNDNSPAFSGSGGTLADDDSTVTVKIWSGSSVGSGNPDYTASATVDSTTGTYSTSGPYTKTSDSSSHSTLPDGTYTAEAFQSNSFGGTAHTDPATFTIDATAPTSSATAPAFINTSFIQVAYTASGTGSALDHVDLYAKGPSDSSYQKVATDQSPVATGHHFTYTASEGDGAYAFYTRAADKATNTEGAPSSADATTTLDTIKPSTSDDVPTSYVNHAVTVTLTPSDSGSGVDKTYYTTGASPADPTTSSPTYDPAHKPTLSDGEKIKYFSTDEAGNAEAVETSPAAKVDTIKPSTSDDVPTSYVNHDVTVTLTPSDSGSGIDHTYYTTGASPADPTTSSPTYDPAHKPTLSDGEKIKYFSTDEAGNAEAVETSPAAQVDTSAPTSSASAPASTSTTTIGVDYTASDAGGSGLAKVELYVKSPTDANYAKAATDSSPGASGHFDYTASEGDGDYAFYTLAYDRAGNAEDAPASPDATTAIATVKPPAPPAPTVTIERPRDGQAFVEGARRKARYSCADRGGPGLRSCEGTVAKDALLDTDAPGSHGFTVTATDRDGRTTTKTVHYTVLSRGRLEVTAPVRVFSRGGTLWVDTGIRAACPGGGPDCWGLLHSHYADHPPLRAASVDTTHVGGGRIHLKGGESTELVFRLGNRRSSHYERGEQIHLWIDARLHRGTKRFAHVRRVVTVAQR